MASIIKGYSYDIFISYRQNDNKYDNWVTEFVDNLNKELEANIKDKISVYFDINPTNGLLEIHSVDQSLEGKLKCLILIPIISRTYCDSKSYAWQQEFCAFNKNSKEDQFGRDIRLASGNVASRILPIKIHDLDPDDMTLLENELGGFLRCIEFIYKSAGVNRPLRANEDNPHGNLNKTYYRDQINKVANAVKEIVSALKIQGQHPEEASKQEYQVKYEPEKHLIKKIIPVTLILLALIAAGYFILPKLLKSAGETEKSVAVLPFENLGSDEDKTWFNDGITDIIINQLTKIDNLRVLARTSTLQYKETKKTISEIGKELQVNYIIEGTIQRQEDKIRISVQLIRVHNEDHLWSEIYDRHWEAIFEVQSDIAEKVAQELKTILTPEEIEKIKEKGTDSNEAYDLYLKGRYFLNRRTKDDLIKSVEYLGQSIEIDHNYGLAYAGLAEAYYIMTYYNWIDQKEGWAKSKEFTLKSLEIDKNLPEAHITHGAIALWNEWDWKVAGAEFKLAVDLNPNLPTAHQYFAEYLNIIGRNDEAFEQIDLALRLDPLSLVINHVKSWIYFSTQDYSEALKQIQKVHEIDKNFTTAYLYAFYSYMRQKMYPEAVNELKKSLSVRIANLKYAQSIDSIYQDSGIEGVLELLIHIYSSASFPNNYNLAKAYSELGDKEMAIKYLEEAFNMHDPSVIHILNNPSFIDLYPEPGFKAIVMKMGLSVYQKVK